MEPKKQIKYTLHPEIKAQMKQSAKGISKSINDLRKAKSRHARDLEDQKLLNDGKYPDKIKEYTCTLDQEYEELLNESKEEEARFIIAIPQGKTRREAAAIIHNRCYQLLKSVDIQVMDDQVTKYKKITKLDYFTDTAKQFQTKPKVPRRSRLRQPQNHEVVNI